MWVKTMDGKLRNLSHCTFVEARETFLETQEFGGDPQEVLDDNGQKILRTINVTAYVNSSSNILASLSTDDGLSGEEVQNKANLAMARLTEGLERNEGLVSLEFLR